MTKWSFESGHTAAEFCVRHMMVTWVRGTFKNVEGTLVFDPANPANSSAEIVIKVSELYTGDKNRDAHLKNADFLDADKHPTITFKSNKVELVGENEFKVTGDLTIKGVTKKTTLDVHYNGQWQTPWWEGKVDKGPKARAGFVAQAKINRQDFGVSWNSTMDKGGIVVGNEIIITIDAEAIKSD